MGFVVFSAISRFGILMFTGFMRALFFFLFHNFVVDYKVISTISFAKGYLRFCQRLPAVNVDSHVQDIRRDQGNIFHIWGIRTLVVQYEFACGLEKDLDRETRMNTQCT